MKCIICGKWSIKLVCNICDNTITLSPQKRISYDGFAVYSFFAYQSVEYLLKSKYHLIGSKIYKILAHKAYSYFKDNVKGDFSDTYAIGIDDRVERFYSHSGVIVREFRHIFKPIIGALIATNGIHYAGKSLEYRQHNKKGFIYSGLDNINAILIDDIITSGLSLKEARETLESHGVIVPFALTLCDARF